MDATNQDPKNSYLEVTDGPSSPKRSLKDKLKLRSPSPMPSPTPAFLTPEEERAERLRIRKERHAEETKKKDKENRRKEKIMDHSNSSGGVYTQLAKKDDGNISWWRMLTLY